MSEQGDETDKKHDPTQKKLDEARKKGDIPKSNDLLVAASYFGLLICVLMAGAGSIETLGAAMVTMIDQSSALAPEIFNGDARALLGSILSEVGLSMMPWFIIPALLVIATLVAQRGITFAGSKLHFKASRISPISNAKNKYGRNGIFEFSKSFIKLLVYSGVLALFIRARLAEMAAAAMGEPVLSIGLLVEVATEFLFVAFLVALVIGALDFLWQRAEHIRKNRMSDKEMRDEHKEVEGDPHMKQLRRQRAQEIAFSQMMGNIPKADVIITNPTHYAVALKWSREKHAAPECIAKGVDEIAARIREEAQRHGIPMRQDPPTARAIYASVEIGQEVKPENYMAVAAAIRFADAMRKRSSWKR
ncbi:EscU/YscU/HrcU family type III secretion system export apparatus switch protein [Rhodalgimonas zhirmunskyi]|uniref:Flagellar type III secretion system protein FlhB n=1 Tax=Rhodalgimonas zhirmunskyi TaxID=2964767 RepID=A0AAJ1X466_9RHOB|nr:flagellar type III secretion system protein FlhB [Rhodoalgimonas zhirmunskyi]MDQ2093983.1 flagellar type III secretion system protein FlhB [Rhodoalgimonas zhirmunskyi]